MNLRAVILMMCLTMSLPVIAQGQVLLDEDFQDGVADDFHPDSDIWSITKSGRYTVELDGFEVASWNRAGNSGWTDYVFDLDMRSKVSVNHAVAVRMQDSGDCYVVNLRSRPYHDAVLSKYVSGEYHHLVFQPAKVNGEWQHFSVEVLGATISVYMDGTMLFSHTDQTDPFLTGGSPVGCTCPRNSSWTTFSSPPTGSRPRFPWKRRPGPT